MSEHQYLRTVTVDAAPILTDPSNEADLQTSKSNQSHTVSVIPAIREDVVAFETSVTRRQ
jgi:hypothetical protein